MHILDIELVRDELLNLLLAARDTVSTQCTPTNPRLIHWQTTSLLTFVTYVLACHPDIYQRLGNEIEQTMGCRHIPTVSDIKSMKYCGVESWIWVLLTLTLMYFAVRAVLNEVLRLFPPVPFNIRRC